MAKENYPFLTKERTYADLVRNDQMELAPQNDFMVDDSDIADKFSFTDTWSGHAYQADEGTVVIGQGIIVGVKDNDYNTAPTLVDTSSSIKPLAYSTTLPSMRDRRWTNLLIADSEKDDDSVVNPIGMLRYHAFKNIDCAHSGNNVTVYTGPCVVEVPYLARSVAASMQLGCITDAWSGGAVSSLLPGDYVTVGGSDDLDTAVDLSGKMRRMLATDDPRLRIGQVTEIKRFINMRGWVEKVSLGLYDFKRAKEFWTTPTTADCPPWADDAELKWPGPNVPQMGRGIGGGLTDSQLHGVTIQLTHTVTEAEDTANAGTNQFNIFRWEDYGTTLGYVDPTTIVFATDGAGTVTGSVTAAGAITWANASVAEDDVITFTATAYGQIPGIAANFTVATDQDDVDTQRASVGLAVVRLMF